MKLLKKSLIALSLVSAGLSASAMAESFAITNATLHTASDKGVIENAVVVVNDGVITAINPEKFDVDSVVDAQGQVVTPGLIGSMNVLGMVEVSAVSDSADYYDKKADITFDASYGYNPKASSIAYTRKGGITRNIVTASATEDIFAGQTFVTDLSGNWESIEHTNNAVFVELGANHDGSRVSYLQTFENKLEKAKKSLEKAKTAKKDEEQELEAADEVINQVLVDKKLILVAVDRASDILAVLKLKQQYDLNLVLVGAADAVLIADRIAKANVPVIMDAMANLPTSFDSLHHHLENAGKLTKAGVKVILTQIGESHNLYNMRYGAGNAVANGMDYQAALASMTSNVATTFNLNSGSIEVGKAADIVIWSGDPFEYNSQVVKMYIKGEEQSTQSRQDKLRERYTTESDLPRAYTH